MEQIEKLTPRHWAFYRLIEQSGEGMDILELAEIMGYEKEKTQYIAHTTYYRDFHNLKEEINNSSEVDKMIVLDKGRIYRLATQKEAIEHYNQLYKRGMDYLTRASRVSLKITGHGQGKTVNNQDRPMNDACKPYHEAFRETEFEVFCHKKKKKDTIKAATALDAVNKWCELRGCSLLGEADIGKSGLGISLWLVQEDKESGEYLKVSVTSR